jgi:hypothetical protein
MKKPMRFTHDRPATAITLTMPADVLEDLETIAREKDMENAEALIRFYIGKELRHDLADFRRKHAGEEILAQSRQEFAEGKTLSFEEMQAAVNTMA